jgi:hypothetical protein
MWCSHFERPYQKEASKADPVRYLKRAGMCTKDPVWIEVAGDHYCSHIVLSRVGDNGTTVIARWWLEQRIDNDKRLPKLREEIKRLKETNRQLREKAKVKAVISV